MPARKHHYVPQWYLRRWGDEKGRVVFSRNGTVLPPTNPKNILAKRDFYAAPTLTVADIAWLSRFVMSQNATTRPMSESILERALFQSTMRTQVMLSPQLLQKERESLTAALIEVEERRLAISESKAKQVVDLLLEGGVGVLRDSESAVCLLEFLGDMYFRTLGARERGRQIRTLSDGGIAVLTRMLGASMACSLFFDRSVMPATLLSNRTSRAFITSDNPAVNILKPEEDRVPTDDEYALYFPLSPTHALIVPPWDHTFAEAAATEQLAAGLNAWMSGGARETLVAKTKEDLENALGESEVSPPSMREWFSKSESVGSTLSV